MFPDKPFLIAGSMVVGIYLRFQSANGVSFTMKKDETYQSSDTMTASIDAGNGYFTVPKDGKLKIHANASIDDGKLHIVITDENHKIYYQLDGQSINDSQTLYFNKGSYIIQIVADDYTEDIVSLNYYVKVKN